MSRWRSGLVSADSDPARWRRTSRPVSTACRQASSSSLAWSSSVWWPGTSPWERCDQTETTSIRPWLRAALAAASRAAECWSAAPPRASPVSTSRWTLAGRPALRPASTAKARVRADCTETFTSAAVARRMLSAEVCTRARIGASRPVPVFACAHHPHLVRAPDEPVVVAPGQALVPRVPRPHPRRPERLRLPARGRARRDGAPRAARCRRPTAAASSPRRFSRTPDTSC